MLLTVPRKVSFSLKAFVLSVICVEKMLVMAIDQNSSGELLDKACYLNYWL